MNTLVGSRSVRDRLGSVAALLALAAVASCSADSGTTPGDGPGGATTGAAVNTVRVTPASSELGLGGTLQLKLTALDAQDNEVAGRPTVWASADTAVAAVSANGLVTARRIGVAQLQVAVDGRSAFSVVNVVAARVGGIAVTPTNASVAAGSVVQLTARITDAGGAALSDRLVFWQSSNNAVALVTSTGLVSGRAAGTATVTATSEGKSATVQVTVTGVVPPPRGGAAPAAVDSVKVEPADTTMARNTTARFRARVFSGNRVVTDRAIEWSVTQSSDGAEVLAVTAGGDVSALNRANVSGFVNATAGGVAGSARVTVVNKAATAVVVNAPASSIEKGRSFVLAALVRDDEGNASDEPLTWESSAPNVLAVTTAGVEQGSARASAIEVGSATITARTGRDVRGSVTIAVTNPPAPVVTTARVDVSPSSRSLLVGETHQLAGSAFDTRGARRDGRTFTWRSSAPTVASVSATGLVTAAGPGTATIIASDEGAEGSSVITVTVPPPPIVTQRVEVTPLAGPLLPGATAQLTASAFDNNNARRDGRTFTWTSSNPAVAAVASNGPATAVVTAVSSGPPAIISAVADGVTGSTNVTVSPPPRPAVARVTVAPGSQALNVGQSGLALAATPLDAAGTALSGRDAPAWTSSNPAVATVNAATGVVTGVAPGTATITATIEGVAGTATITVNAPRPASVARVTVALAPATIEVRRTAQATASAFDANGTELPGRGPAAWTSSNPAVATVSDAGVVTGVAVGTASITATIEGTAANATVTVTVPPPAPVARVDVTTSAATLEIGQTTQVTARAFDARGDSLPGRPATWRSSNPEIATVSSAGVVTAVSPGRATITGTIEGQSGTVTITVNSRPASTARVEVTPPTPSIVVGSIVPLTATSFDGAGAPRGPRNYRWASSNTAVATVDDEGRVRGLAAGTATITATDGNVPGSATVTVTTPTTASVLVTPATASIVAGGTQPLTAVARDAAGTAIPGRTFTWQSSNPAAATVDGAGLVRGVSAGSATITAADGNVTGSAAITVTAPPVTPGRVDVVPVASVAVVPAAVTLQDRGSPTLREAVLTARPLSAANDLLAGRSCTWSGGRTADGDRVVSISPTSATTARVRGEDEGITTVVATCEGPSGAATVTVRERG